MYELQGVDYMWYQESNRVILQDVNYTYYVSAAKFICSKGRIFCKVWASGDVKIHYNILIYTPNL